MRIVSILPEHDPKTKINYRINIGFINKLNTLCDYYPIQAYNRDNILVSSQEVWERLKPDVILLLAHSDILDGYLKNIPCLKVMISVDFRKILERKKFHWYKNNQFDLVIQRGAYDVKSFNKYIGIPSVWVPYSADEKEFYPGEKNINRMGFAGTTSNTSYAQRRKALQLLGNLVNNGGKIVSNDEYALFLRSHVAMLTDTQIKDGRRSPHAKMFEILASGSVCLTPEFDYNFLPKKGCSVVYKDDCSDIIKKAKWIIDNPEESDIISKDGYNEFLMYHTDAIRIKELYKHINDMIEGKEITKQWGI